MKTSRIMLAGLLLLTGSLGFKVRQIGRESVERLRVASSELAEAETITQGLLDRIHALRTPPYSLAGTEATSGDSVLIEEVDSAVVFLLSTSCGYCAKSVPYLNRLHATGVRVLGMSLTERRSFLESFARAPGAAFPLIADPTGSVLDILPTDAVPLTAVFLGGRLMTLWLGPLGEGRQLELEREFGVTLERNGG